MRFCLLPTKELFQIRAATAPVNRLNRLNRLLAPVHQVCRRVEAAVASAANFLERESCPLEF